MKKGEKLSSAIEGIELKTVGPRHALACIRQTIFSCSFNKKKPCRIFKTKLNGGALL